MEKLRWSEADDDVIRQRYPAGGIHACQALLQNRTYGAVEQRAQHLGVGRDGQRPWTMAEVAYLKVNYPSKGLRGVGKLCQRHSKTAIFKMASRLKLGRMRKKGVMTFQHVAGSDPGAGAAPGADG